MDHDQQFLSFIHKNVAMGVSAIPQVLSLPQSRAMGQALNRQLQEYGPSPRSHRHMPGSMVPGSIPRVWLSGPCPVPCSRPALPPTTPPPSWLS